jgi:hypothetical protein
MRSDRHNAVINTQRSDHGASVGEQGRNVSLRQALGHDPRPITAMTATG